MSKVWEKLHEANRELHKEYEQTLKRYVKVCKTSELRLAKRLTEKESNKKGYFWVNEKEPPSLFRIDDYAYQTVHFLVTQVRMNDNYVCIKEYWDDRDDKLKSCNVDCNLWGYSSVPFVNELIDKMEQEIQKQSKRSIIARIRSKI